MKIKASEIIYLVSPHLDDAIFSTGGFISKISKTNKVILINIFTSPGSSNETISSNTYLKQVGYPDKIKLFKDRITEDKKAANFVGIHKVINLGFVDALWREKNKTILGKILPEFDRVYPTYRYHIIKGKISKHDQKLIEHVAGKLKKIIPPKNSVIFCPMGFGNHVDHIVTREATRLVVSEDKLQYWADYPYVSRLNSKTNFFENNIFDSVNVPISPLQKTKVCAIYKTQYAPVLDNKTIPSSEVYYKLLSPKFKSSINNLFYAIYHEPKDTIFNILNYKNTPVTVKPFSVKDLKIAKQIIEKIKSIIPYSKPKLIGSLALKSAGQGDIDIIIGVSIDKFQKSTVSLKKVFGEPKKTKLGFTQWKIKYKSRDVDMDLLDILGHRYILQSNQLKKIQSDSLNLKEYRQLKHSTSKTNKFWYSIARVIYFHKLNNNKYANNFDNSLTLVKRFGVKKHVGAYTFSIYSDTNDNKIFVKRWSGKKKNLTYYWLKNEISVYKLLSKLGVSGTVFAPKFIFDQHAKESLSLGLEYVKGRDLTKLEAKEKLGVFFKAISYLNNVYKLSTKNDLAKISHRGPIYWLSILPLICLRAVFLHPDKAHLILKGFISVYLSSTKILFRKQRTLVHRDFNNYNCFIYKNKICLIDFQLTCVADPAIEYAVILLKYFDNPHLKKQLLTILNKQADVHKTLLAVKNYLTIFALYDLSLSDGSHFLSLPALKEQVKI